MATRVGQTVTPLLESSPGETSPKFDIASHYQALLQDDADLNAPIAAIESLIALLSASPSSTISETLKLIEDSVLTLKNSIQIPLPLSAGTDLFQRYILSALQTGSTDDFDALRAHLLANSKLFVKRAKEARASIGNIAKQLIQEDAKVLTCNFSRVVAAVLKATVHDGITFNLVQVQSTASPINPSAKALVTQLRDQAIPVAVTDYRLLATAMSKATLAIVGAECVVENGGIISLLGTRQVAILAKSMKKPLYVVAESHKFVRKYPLEPEDLGVESNVLNFETRADTQSEQDTKLPSIQRRLNGEHCETGPVDLDYIPPELITALITESGLHTPGFVSEELLKLWS